MQKALAGGCHLNRDMERLVSDSPLAIQRCEKFYLPKTPRLWGYTYRGAALKIGR